MLIGQGEFFQPIRGKRIIYEEEDELQENDSEFLQGGTKESGIGGSLGGGGSKINLRPVAAVVDMNLKKGMGDSGKKKRSRSGDHTSVVVDQQSVAATEDLRWPWLI
ncbi:hypothetical protein PIB30_059184 [Stylosanthes scabra]|uniref:Uncharacterized protein n=1 Tax=Stylosanthes scabra TaxID=79078 RepID=A0ABU6UJL3_9FABA|nr:hypothetical protein [Stylosanthes scabra]